MTREELDRWHGEQQLVEDLLTKIEQAERRILKGLNCPTDPVVLYAMLTTQRETLISNVPKDRLGLIPEPAPMFWPGKMAARERRRARHAMQVLVNVASVRSETHKLEAGNPRMAAYHALLAGIYAGDAAANAVRAAMARETQQRATAHAAQDRRETRQLEDARLRELAHACRARHPEWSYSALATTVRRELASLAVIDLKRLPAIATIRKRLPSLLK